MRDRIFIDTNLWIYLYSEKPKDKSAIVEMIIDENFDLIHISTQTLGEIYNTLTKKNIKTNEETKKILFDLVDVFKVENIDAPKVLYALNICQKYNYSYWDSLLLATAISSDCDIFYSEDMHHNHLISNKIRIINPFIDI